MGHLTENQNIENCGEINFICVKYIFLNVYHLKITPVNSIVIYLFTLMNKSFYYYLKIYITTTLINKSVSLIGKQLKPRN